MARTIKRRNFVTQGMIATKRNAAHADKKRRVDERFVEQMLDEDLDSLDLTTDPESGSVVVLYNGEYDEQE